MKRVRRPKASGLDCVMPPTTTDMRAYLKEQADLAYTYACDGAYHSAAKILTELALAIKAHAVTSDDRIRQFMDGKK